jgi:hypothetical protein
MSVVDKVKGFFDGRPEVHRDDEGYWVDVGGTKYRGASLQELEKELRREIRERSQAVGDKQFDVVRVSTEMISTADMARPQVERMAELEGALAVVQEERARVEGDEIPGTETDPRAHGDHKTPG